MTNSTNVPLIEYVHVFWGIKKQGCSHETRSYDIVISQSEIPSSLFSPVNDVPQETDEAGILLKTNEADISFEMMITELHLDLISWRVRRQLDLEFSHDPSFSWYLYDIRPTNIDYFRRLRPDYIVVFWGYRCPRYFFPRLNS